MSKCDGNFTNHVLDALRLFSLSCILFLFRKQIQLHFSNKDDMIEPIVIDLIESKNNFVQNTSLRIQMNKLFYDQYQDSFTS